MRARVVVPTWNERESIAELLERVLAVPGVGVLVVDDGSPDGTAEYVARVAEGDERVALMRRPGKGGLGGAYREGFARAREMGDARWIGQMDADLSHPPERIPDLLAPLEGGEADLVVGSRYVPGGYARNWNAARRLLSSLANRYVRAVTGIPQRDTTAGFRFWDRDLLARLPWERIRSDGFGFQIETGWHAWRLGARVVEVPIEFVDRARGKSKLSGGIIREAAGLPWRLRRQTARSARP